MSPPPQPFKPALIIVDLQEDFCPPSGTLAVADARAIVPAINALLRLPFALKIATKDWHPADHVSFAANHAAPDNKPFESETTITHPAAPARTFSTRLWPVHCVQGTAGAELVPELEAALLDHVVEKGQDRRVEMYSAFTDPFHEGELPWSPESSSVCTSGLPALLKRQGVTDVFLVGLATDYCVQATAEDAVKFGYRAWVVPEATRAVGGEEGVSTAAKEMEGRGVKMVRLDGEELGWVKALGA